MTDQQQQNDTTTQNIAEAIQEVSERATLLVREEIELAKLEVTEKITEAYELIAGIVERAQADGAFKDTVTPRFAAMAFYGAIEQVLSGWIFETLPRGETEFEEAKTLVVETICGGLDAAPATA